jgi:hypothetical protein
MSLRGGTESRSGAPLRTGRGATEGAAGLVGGGLALGSVLGALEGASADRSAHG